MEGSIKFKAWVAGVQCRSGIPNVKPGFMWGRGVQNKSHWSQQLEVSVYGSVDCSWLNCEAAIFVAVLAGEWIRHCTPTQAR